MKILCVADHIDPLVYSNGIRTRFKGVEMVLGAGDLPLDYYSYIVTCLNRPLYFVYGNHNLEQLQRFKSRKILDPRQYEEDVGLKESVGATYLEDRGVHYRKVLIAGLGGSMRYNDGDHQFSEFQMVSRILGLLPRLIWNRIVHGRWLDILLTHAPPRGIHDKPDRCHTGFKAFLWFMDWFKPKFLIHGHIHLYELQENRKTQYKNTLVLNCYDHYVLDFEEKNG